MAEFSVFSVSSGDIPDAAGDCRPLPGATAVAEDLIDFFLFNLGCSLYSVRTYLLFHVFTRSLLYMYMYR
jgi:hypothetical protein